MLTNVKNEKFCIYHYGGDSPKDAAIKAGFSKKTASAAASRLLKREDVRKRLAELSDASLNDSILTKQQVLEMLTDIAKNEEKTYAKIKALELLGKHHRAFTDVVEQTGPPPRINPVFMKKEPDSEP